MMALSTWSAQSPWATGNRLPSPTITTATRRAAAATSRKRATRIWGPCSPDFCWRQWARRTQAESALDCMLTSGARLFEVASDAVEYSVNELHRFRTGELAGALDGFVDDNRARSRRLGEKLRHRDAQDDAVDAGHA